MSWIISYDELIFNVKSKSSASASFSDIGSKSVGNGCSTGKSPRKKQQYALYQGQEVVVKYIAVERVVLSKETLTELQSLRLLEHSNLLRFMGACIQPPNIAAVFPRCTRGSLAEILDNDALNLDHFFKFSLIYDVIRGLEYLHDSSLGVHGRMASHHCVVDTRFVLKLSNFGLNRFREGEKVILDSATINYNLLWRSPEYIRGNTPKATREDDIYGVAIIIHEIIDQNGPFSILQDQLEVEEIVSKVMQVFDPPFRPQFSSVNAADLKKIAEKCWAEDSHKRPTASSLVTSMKRINKHKAEGNNLLDNILFRMEQYANNLETLVEQRTKAFMDEKKRSETLLYEVLPRSVAQQLMKGVSVHPESYDSVTIYFSDIVGFTEISAKSSPMEVVKFLNDLYSCFDAIIGYFDVYKVETIGDAYMVVSGLPIRNGIEHARQIAFLALALLDSVKTFQIHHMPDEKLQLRCGIHSGSCVAGVVGLKMPRYCLFGDTVNVASRMESTGEALKIHVSNITKDLLDMIGNFQMELRGEMNIKGIGNCITFWLRGSTGNRSRAPMDDGDETSQLRSFLASKDKRAFTPDSNSSTHNFERQGIIKEWSPVMPV